MKRRTFFLGVGGLAGCTRDSRPRLNVYNWSAYIAPETIPGFEAEFGVHVRYGTYESNEEMLAKVLSGKRGVKRSTPPDRLLYNAAILGS